VEGAAFGATCSALRHPTDAATCAAASHHVAGSRQSSQLGRCISLQHSGAVMSRGPGQTPSADYEAKLRQHLESSSSACFITAAHDTNHQCCHWQCAAAGHDALQRTRRSETCRSPAVCVATVVLPITPHHHGAALSAPQCCTRWLRGSVRGGVVLFPSPAASWSAQHAAARRRLPAGEPDLVLAAITDSQASSQ
jgi:hypothetical protein